MSVEDAKFPSQDPLMVFRYELWGVVAHVAATHEENARWLLAQFHHFEGHWLVSPSVNMENLGWDSGPDVAARRKGDASRIFNVSEPPPFPDRPDPEGALL